MSSPLTALSPRWTVVPDGRDGLRAVEDATVLVRGGRILDVVRGPTEVGARRVELGEAVLIPGFVNLHNHALNGPVFRGIVDDAGPETAADSIVYGVLLPLGDHAGEVLSEDEIRAVYRLALMEILRSGTTTVLDMPRAVHRQYFAVARELGLRAWGAPYIFSTPTRGLDASGRPVYGRTDENRSLRDALEIADAFDEGPGGLIRVGFGPHATDTCSPELLRRIAREAKDRGTIVSVHAAQSRIEVDTVRERHGRTPVEFLYDNGALGPHVVAAHCVYAEDGDLTLLRETGTTVAHCPLTFARSGVTVSFDRFHRQGVRTGIGTDAYSFDYFAELRAAGFIAKLTSGESGAGDAATLLRAATEVGASALPQPGLGRIEAGYAADLVAVDLSAPHLQPVRDPLRNLVWNATPADVSLVMIDGKVVVRHGTILGCDEAAAVRAATAAVHRLWESAERKGVLAARGNGHLT
ncbi:amidohydrolase family protein [Streptomyces sp. NPDC051018]|uniref:amidohydrolase family protein n=1 Tax=Streptomyces sp. NPDC051018 TaxID=3365639 RepID=UPI0037B4BDCB